MRGRTTLILFGILIVLSTYVYFIEIKGRAEKEKSEEKNERILSLIEDDIIKVIVKSLANKVICERDGEEWCLTSPIKTKGDKTIVNNLVEEVIKLKIEREILGEENLSDFGLDPPEFTVVLESEKGEKDSLFFGEKNPTNRYLFVKKPDDARVLLTGTSVHRYLTKTVFEFRDKSVFTFEKENIGQISLKRRNQSDIVINKEEKEWRIILPITAPADQYAVDGILDKLKWAKAKGFEEEEPKSITKYGLDRPYIDLTITMSSKEVQKKLIIGKKKEKNLYFAKDVDRTPVFTVDSTLIRELEKSLFELRDKKVVHFDRDNVQTIEIMYRDNPTFICFKDTAGDWRIQSFENTRAKKWKISSLISNITNLKVEKFVGQKITGLEHFNLHDPQIQVFLKDEKGELLVHLAVGKEIGEKKVYIMNKLTSWIYQIKNDIIADLNLNIADIAEKEQEDE